MAATLTVPFYGIEGPANVGALVRVRVRNPDDTTNGETPTTEETSTSGGLGIFSGSGAFTLPDIPASSKPYTWEARQVTAQNSAAFDAAPVTAVLAPKQPMGWVSNGVLYTDPNIGAILSGAFTAAGVSVISGTPTSPYIVWQEFVNRFGWMNIVKSSNKDGYQVTAGGTVQQIDNQKTPNYYAIQDAFNYAAEKINSELMGGVLQIPLDFTPNAGVVPIRVRRWAMVIAFCDLLNMRNPDKSVKRIRTSTGWKTESAGGDSMGSQLEEALMDIAMHKNGQWRQMPEAKHATSATPGAVPSIYRGFCRYVDGVPIFAGYLMGQALGLSPQTQWGASSDNLGVTGSDVYST